MKNTLKEGYEFRPRFYPSALAAQKKVKRKARGLAPSTQGKSPLPQHIRKALKAKRRRERAEQQKQSMLTRMVDAILGEERAQ